MMRFLRSIHGSEPPFESHLQRSIQLIQHATHMPEHIRLSLCHLSATYVHSAREFGHSSVPASERFEGKLDNVHEAVIVLQFVARLQGLQ